MAIILRTGNKQLSVVEMARELLEKIGNITQLAAKNVQELKKINGIGNDKAATLVAAFELARRIEFKEKWYSDKKIRSPQEIGEIFIPILRDATKEKFIVVSLNSANKIIKYDIISEGNINSSIVHPREVFKVAIENLAVSIILIHNHPSGNEQPSREDIEITKKLVEAGKIMSIQIFDHIIIAGQNYFSFVESRLI